MRRSFVPRRPTRAYLLHFEERGILGVVTVAYKKLGVMSRTQRFPRCDR